jgi:acyl transferase domain-containing protein
MTAPEPIAIIGTGCRFPGASSSPARLWKLLQNPRDVSSKVPADRFNIDAFYHHDGSHHGTTNVREAYFLSEDVRLFDASFFNVSAREAEAIDPQQRLLMETVYEAVEAAGLRLEDLQGSSTGVFCGVMRDDYGSILFRDPGALPQYAATGTGRSILSNRISYFFDWHGPSITLDTACSSSLVAVHLAAKALLDGDCPVAIAAGTNLILDPDMFISEAKLNMLSPSGRSHMWDAMADGYAAGEGVAAIVLKRLSDAIADGDCIECIIKATNINQDGRSLGITMPSSTAQTRLIRSTYEKAGLDLARPEDRCQYFEAHGTGTPAGDPEEANAIHAAFFSSGSTEDARGKLYVGSIKTVVGHTEGTAGLAGLIKASLSIQRGVIPPNMHFESVNPKIAPLTSRLRVPTDPLPWPALPPGVPRRASVNSFGFGGTNAHVILEAYSPPAAVVAMAEGPVVLPFTFSAHTDKILGSVLERHAAYVRQHPETDPRRLAWSLSRRRSVFTHKISFSAPSLQALLAQIDAELQLRKEGKATTVVSRIGAGSKSLLGVFTGQGAQWPQMGLDLVSASPAAEASFRAMQVALDELPPQYQSDFSLVRELSAPKSESRLDRAVVSQPLCTAIQIVLVDFLHTLGIRFAAVAGHSSGEIACAYAAGVITAVDAIRIAYLRGFFAKLAGADGKPGAMLAAGLAPDEARDICKQPKFAGKIALAACNSPSSVTLSGDVEAIKEVELLLKGQEKFARLVKVDTAYHSHHMLPCAEPYVQALEACNVRPRPPSGTRWFSSVLDGQEIGAAHCDLFKAQYWKDNMVNTVLFSQALGAAVEGMEALDLAVEVGPHPALKGPALQTISEARETANELPYFGLLSRGSSGVGAFSSAVGALWAHVGARSLDLGSYTRLFQGTESTSYLEGLPSYPFDRSQSYWCEARSSKARTHRKEPPNQLLGVPTTDVAEGEWRWTNYLRRSEIEWLDGHRIQSQTVFPATGYVAMALEAVSIAAGAKSLCSVEVLDFSIGRAISFGDDTTGVETLFLLEDLHMEEDGLSASFTCHANFGGTLTRCASGTVQVAFGKQDIAALSRRAEQSRGMRNIDVDEFYSSLEELGYGYTGLFRGITSLMRKKDAASGHLSNAAVVNHGSPLLLHPALTDTVLQAMLATVGLPGDGRLYTLMVPTQISRISINPLFCGPRQAQLGDQLAFDANLTSLSQGGATGDAHLYDNNGHGIVHMEGIRVSELMAPLPADDRLLFAEVSWGCLEPDAAAAYAKVSPERVELADSQSWADHKERTALYYLKTIVAQLTPEDRERFSWHQRTLVAWMERTLSQTMAGKHPTCKAEWLMDTLDDVLRDEARYPPLVDHQLYNAIGRGCLPFLRGEGTILEELRDSGLLIDVYRLGVDFLPLNNHVGELAAQLAFKYPHMKILEIGAGTGSVTQCVIDRLGHRYHSYTFTDISAGFFDDAEARFAEHSNLFVYRVLDIEKDALQQNFKEHEYDLIIAANVLHATQPLKDTMTRVRTLLKPGGHLLMLEGTRPEEVALTFCFGAFEGWWRGESDKRRSGPMMKPAQWDALLRDTGFSGVEAITPNHEKSPRTFSVMMTQAVDDTINQLRSPLTFIERVPKYDELIIVGGTTPTTRSLVADLKPILSNYFRRVLESASLNSLDLRSSSVVTVLNLADLDSPCLRDITAGCYASLQRLMDAAKTVLWVSGDPEEDPYQGMSRAMLSCLGYENPYSRFQHLSVSHRDTPTAHLLATMLLRLTKTDFENDHKFPKLSWATEGELKLEGGKLYVPRICHSKPLNDRYRADRRKIRNPVDIRRSAVKLVDSGSAYDFVEEVGEESSIADGIRIKVTHSTLAASRVKGVGFLHLVLGRALDTQAQLLALTESHASITTAPPCWVVPCSVPEGQEAGFLSMVVCSLLADYISDVAERNSAVLVYGANPMLTRAITDRSFVKGIHAYFDAGLPNDSSESSSVHHKMRSALSPKFSIPKNVSAIVQLCKDSSRIPARVASLVPKYVNRLSLGDMYSDSSVVPPYSDMSKASESLRVAYLSAGPALSLTAQVGTFHVLQADEIPNFSHTASGLQIVEWTKTTHVPVAVQTASSMLRLSSNKTYLLAGMTGDTGRSICQWMIERGARNVVLTSRSPKVDRWWIDEMAAAGAKVAAMSM